MKLDKNPISLATNVLLTAALFAVISAMGAFAQGSSDHYPSQLIRIIVPFAAGGTADALARIVGDNLSQRWGTPVIVENKPGDQGNIGMALVAKSPPDGYTLALVRSGTPPSIRRCSRTCRTIR
jgi:tripartite-type tricarboxylate transporter receptor subunit TctC